METTETITTENEQEVITPAETEQELPPMTFADILNEITYVLSAFDGFDNIDDEEEQQRIETRMLESLDVLRTLEAEKVDKLAAVILRAENDVAFLEMEKKKVEAKLSSTKTRIEHTRNYISAVMRGNNLNEVNGKIHRFSFRKSQKVEINASLDDLEKLDENYIRIKREPNASYIKDDLKSGVVIDGCEIVTNYNLQLK